MTLSRQNPPRLQFGLTLVELMIALALGLLVVLAVTNIFIANRATFKSQEALAQVQQNARIGYELLAHDIRESGGNSCGIPASQTANIINNSTANWWANLSAGNLQGFEANDDAPIAKGSAVKERAAGTDALIVRGARAACEGNDLVIGTHVPGAAQFTVNAQHCIVAGDILVACDLKRAAIFQASAVDKAAKTINHAADLVGAITSPGNCAAKFLPGPTCATNTDYPFDNNGIVSRFSSNLWFIGNNGRGKCDHVSTPPVLDGCSLFRARPKNAAVPDPLNPGVSTPTIVIDIEEIAEGIVNMQIEYLVRNGGNVLEDDYKVATLVGAAWNASPNVSAVVAVRITLTLNSTNKAGTNTKALERTFVHVISLRNQENVQ